MGKYHIGKRVESSPTNEDQFGGRVAGPVELHDRDNFKLRHCPSKEFAFLKESTKENIGMFMGPR
jgi:hypothetical protein